MSTELRGALEQVARRLRHARLWGGLAACWLAWAVVGVGVARWSNADGRALITFAALAAATGCVYAALANRSARDLRSVARRIEAKHPELGTGLLAAVEEVAAGRTGFLPSAVIREALDHRRATGWDETVPGWSLLGAKVAHAAALGALLLALAGIASRAVRTDAARRAALAAGAGAKVEPGDTEVERGASLLVVARFPGAVPADATLVSEPRGGKASRLGMSRSLEDPTFAGRVESVAADLAYRVEFGGRSSPTYHARVFEYPTLERADATLIFPAYTSAGPKTVEDVRHVTAVEGTELTLTCRLNKDVKAARLVDAEGREIALTPQAVGTAHAYEATVTLNDPKRYRVKLVDAEGRANKVPAELVVNVTRNRPAAVKMSQPAHDVRVSPVEELTLKAQAEDDYGVVRHGLSYSVAGAEPREVVLGGAGPKVKSVKAEHMLAFESFKAEPDQLVTYFFWAEDVGPDGKPRRSSGDMFFAEVRHFEEIFRQGEPPPGGESAENENEQDQGNARQAEKLAELQKEVINGTWKLIRRETGAKPSDKFADDARLLASSQHSAIGQAEQLGKKLTDPASKASLDRAVRSMKDAETRLGEAVRVSSVGPFRPALAAEQSAYQAMLKLRAREFEVVRNNRRQRQNSRSSAGSPSQRQLDQLELSDQENRYEAQRNARAQQEKQTQREREQGETRQVVNRLKELARRQTDLNDRLKELQSALEAAKDPKAREDIERQLKRLRDQEQEILRDTDELRERMEREENRDRMAEARQQVEQTRDRVRQASEALEQNRLPQALTEGTRAGRELNELREELRKTASDRFSEELTDLRGQARRLDETQKQLTERLDAWKDRPERSLRETPERKEVRDGLGEQGKQLDRLMERMRRTVQDAEETEPLLARELFDTVKKADAKTIPDALKAAEQLVDAGVPAEASKASRFAGQGLGQLREGVERAAKSVLGDETAALKRARGELEDLADQIDREIARATGRDPRDPAKAPARGGQTPGREGDAAQPPPGQNPQKGQPKGGRPGQEKGQSRQQGQQKGQSPAGQGDQPGEPGQTKGQQGDQPGQTKGQQGNQPGQAKGQQGRPGDQPGQGGQQGNRPGQSKGQQGQQGDQQGQQGQGGQPGGNNPPQGRPRGGSPNGGGGGGGERQAGMDRVLEGLTRGAGGPITGEGFRPWSDRLRDVEELLEDPQLRAEAAKIRDRARGAREEFKRHSKVPDWDQLQGMVADPIRELRDRVAEEVRRRESPGSLVPIDRDPVPPQYAEGVRRYYERLGSGR